MKTYIQLIKAHNNVEFLIDKLEKEIEDKVEFECGIDYQASDGFCLINVSNADLAPLNICLSIIERKGVLSLDDFNENGI